MSSKTVLITGINGFVACHVAVTFLEKGWNVLGTVRNSTKSATVKALPAFSKWSSTDSLRIEVVENFATADFTEILKGVDAIAHLAAPLPDGPPNNTWKEFKTGTIEATINLLKQATKVPSITSVALMSSMAAVFLFVPWNEDRHTYTEDDWTPLSEEEVEAFDTTSPVASIVYYCAAKRLLEEEVVKLKDESSATWSLARLCPPMIYGKLINCTNPDTIAQEGASAAVLAGFIKGESAALDPDFATAWVDVEDVAQAFYSSVVNHKTGRYLIASETSYDNQLVANIARQVRPELKSHIPIGKPDEPTPSSHGTYKVNSSKSVIDLGIKYKPLEQTVGDVLDYFVEIGAIKA